MNLAKYVAKRILLAIVTVFIVCAITFFSMNAIPGGPFEGEKALSPEIKATLMAVSYTHLTLPTIRLV